MIGTLNTGDRLLVDRFNDGLREVTVTFVHSSDAVQVYDSKDNTRYMVRRAHIKAWTMYHDEPLKPNEDLCY